jgi:hypothetical protein
MARRLSKSPLLISFRAALAAGYTQLLQREQFKARILSLGPPSFDNVQVLHKLGIDLLQMLTDETKRTTDIIALAAHWQNLSNSAGEPVLPREILDHISVQLLLYHLGDSTDPGALKKIAVANPATGRYQLEMRNFISLIQELWNHNVDPTRIFAMTITDRRVRMAWYWQDWMGIYDLLRKKAIQYKNRYILLRNANQGLLSPRARKVLVDECKLLCEFCDNVVNAELVKKDDAIYRYNCALRSNSQAWNLLLKNLEKSLSASFSPKRFWQYPGGRKQTATAARVYETINLILHFCYPSIWSFNPSITAAIKSRCHRYSAS